jgi:histone H3/H4
MGGFSLSRVVGGGARVVEAEKAVRTVDIDIKEYTKGTHLIIQRTPFGNYCRDIVFHSISKDGLRFSASSLIALQQAGENMMSQTVSEAVRMVEYNKRSTLCGADLKFINNSEDMEVTDLKKSKLAKLPKTNIVDLCKKAGADRVAADCYSTVVQILHDFLLQVLENTYNIVMSRQKKSNKCLTAPTVKETDVSMALESLDHKVFGLASVNKR